MQPEFAPRVKDSSHSFRLAFEYSAISVIYVGTKEHLASNHCESVMWLVQMRHSGKIVLYVVAAILSFCWLQSTSAFSFE